VIDINIIADVLAYSVIFFMALLISFGLLMKGWVKVKDTQWETPYRIVFGVPFVLADWVCNWTVMILWFQEFPPVWNELVTGRMIRYKQYDPESREYRFAVWLCNKLNKDDPNHC